MLVVFRAKYFSDGDILNASPISNSSFTWKSGYDVKDFMNVDLCRRVGNGNLIYVWNGKRIHGYMSFKPKTPDLHHEVPLNVFLFILV